MIIYDSLNSYSRYKREFKDYKEVTVYKTKYSIKIDFGTNKKIFLNKGDNGKTNVLGLINKVKNDVDSFIEGKEINKTKSNDIFWYYYNELSGVEGMPFEVAKIDLASAYWTKAINQGIVSRETVDYFEGLKFRNVKEKKGARLKALGSLATVKSTEVYNYGKRKDSFSPLIMNEDYRSIYMGICNEVAEDMQTVLSMVNGIYYYWDCIFVNLESIEKVEKIFRSMGYNCTVEKDVGEIFKSKYISYLCCEKTGVKYPINN